MSTSSEDGTEAESAPIETTETKSSIELPILAEIAKVLPPPFQDAFQEAFRDPQKGPQIRSVIAAFSASMYSGPLPPPDQLRAYEDVLPGAAHRIIKMAENQADHRQVIEKIAVKGGNSRSWWGLFSGLVIALSALGGSIYLATNGHTVAGVAIGGIDIVSLVSVFVIGKADQRRERVEKNAQTQLPPSTLPGSPGD